MERVSTTAVATDANDVYAHPPDPDVLELDPVHPGIHDPEYMSRRHDLFALCRRHRLESLGTPLIDYTAEEQRIWRHVSPKLDELHVRHASRIYLDAKRALGIRQDEIPQLRPISEHLQARTGMHLVPAEGLIAYRIFYAYIADGGFPCTQFMRHGSHPEYTPEPDMVHDCLGHVPALLNPDYAALLRMLGRAAVRASSGDHVLALKRLSWFSIEFGLIEEAGETRVFGAGILSSLGEIPFSLSSGVERRPFVTDEVIGTDYDSTKMQHLLFVIPSFVFLRNEVERLIARLNIDMTGPADPAS